MASSFYPKVFEKVLSGELDLSGGAGSDTVKLLLLGDYATYPLDVTHEFVSNLSGELVDGAGGVINYARKTIPVTLSYNSEAGLEGCDLNFALTTNAIWGPDDGGAATFTTGHAILFVDKGGADSANPLLYYFDLSANQVVSSGTFELRNPTTAPRVRRA
jgi:hypothetical protein